MATPKISLIIAQVMSKGADIKSTPINYYFWDWIYRVMSSII